MNSYRAREIAIYTAAFALCVGTPIYGGYLASTIPNFKQKSLEKLVDPTYSPIPTKIAKIGTGVIAGMIVSFVPTTAAMACLGRTGYIGRRDRK